MKLYVNPLSTPALSVMLAANFLGLEHDIHIVDLQNGEQRSPDYMAKFPNGKVPAMSDGDFHLFESGAIIRYMASKAGHACYPADIQARAIADQWQDYVAFHIRTPFSRVQFNRMFAEMFGQERDEKSIEFGLHILSTSLPLVEARIAEHGYVSGDAPGLGDITLLGTLDPAEAVQVDLSAYPALQKWRETLRSEKFYTDVHSHYGVEIGM